MAARIAKSNSKSKSKSKSLKTKAAQRKRTTHMVVGFSLIGAAGYLVGQAIEKAVSYA